MARRSDEHSDEHSDERNDERSDERSDECSDERSCSEDDVQDDSTLGALSSRVGTQMEVQACNPDVCDMMCGICEWEPCKVEADYGNCYDVRVESDGEVCLRVAARFLRIPALGAAAAKRRRV